MKQQLQHQELPSTICINPFWICSLHADSQRLSLSDPDKVNLTGPDILSLAEWS